MVKLMVDTTYASGLSLQPCALNIQRFSDSDRQNSLIPDARSLPLRCGFGAQAFQNRGRASSSQIIPPYTRQESIEDITNSKSHKTRWQIPSRVWDIDAACTPRQETSARVELVILLCSGVPL